MCSPRSITGSGSLPSLSDMKLFMKVRTCYFYLDRTCNRTCINIFLQEPKKSHDLNMAIVLGQRSSSPTHLVCSVCITRKLLIFCTDCLVSKDEGGFLQTACWCCSTAVYATLFRANQSSPTMELFAMWNISTPASAGSLRSGAQPPVSKPKKINK